MAKIIEVKNLTKEFKVRKNKNLLTGLFNPNYEKVVAVDDVSFSVNEGEALALLGPNGAGKTTTTKMLTGLIYPTSGETSVMGYTPFDRQRDYLMQIGLVMGNKAGLNWDLSPTQSFRLLKEIYNVEEKDFKETLGELTTLLDVAHVVDTPVRKLSLGERMKVELIGSILHSPKILFLDEPTIGLDITSRKNTREFLRDLQKKRNITLILTSHDMGDVEKVCDRVIVINKGHKVYDGMLNELLFNYAQEKVVRVFLEEIPEKFDLPEYATLVDKNVEDDYIDFSINKGDLTKLVEHVSSIGNVLDIDILSVPLEDIIEDLFR